jgi:hypothetical protein
MLFSPRHVACFDTNIFSVGQAGGILCGQSRARQGRVRQGNEVNDLVVSGRRSLLDTVRIFRPRDALLASTRCVL